jgi:hypothetical protein
MKKILFSALFLSLFSFNSSAEIRDGFFIKPAFSVEYSAPDVSGGGANSDFKTNLFEKQIKNAENIALGTNIRIHKFIGLNANWAQTDLNAEELQDYGLMPYKARFKLEQYNLSSLFYLPVVEDGLEIFTELGVADISSRLNFTDGNGTFITRKAHETTAIVGVGFQFYFSDKMDDAFRFSYQKYTGKLALLDGTYSTLRLGYLKFF